MTKNSVIASRTTNEQCERRIGDHRDAYYAYLFIFLIPRARCGICLAKVLKGLKDNPGPRLLCCTAHTRARPSTNVHAAEHDPFKSRFRRARVHATTNITVMMSFFTSTVGSVDPADSANIRNRLSPFCLISGPCGPNIRISLLLYAVRGAG